MVGKFMTVRVFSIGSVPRYLTVLVWHVQLSACGCHLAEAFVVVVVYTITYLVWRSIYIKLKCTLIRQIMHFLDSPWWCCVCACVQGAIALCEMVEFYGCASRIILNGNSRLHARAWLTIGRMLKKVSDLLQCGTLFFQERQRRY